jgi:hypothetical protein
VGSFIADESVLTYGQKTSGKSFQRARETSSKRDGSKKFDSSRKNVQHEIAKNKTVNVECHHCGRKGHVKSECFHNPQSENNRKGRPVCYKSNLSTYMNFLVDTGASVSLVCGTSPVLATTQESSTRVIKVLTLHGIASRKVLTNVKLMNVSLEKVIIEDEPEIVMEGCSFRGILGMDFIRMMGGLNLSFTDQSPTFQFYNQHLYMHTEHETMEIEEESQVDITTYEYSDFTLYRKRDPVNKNDCTWDFAFKWLDGEPPYPHKGPREYKSKLSTEDEELFYSEVELWKTNGFIRK